MIELFHYYSKADYCRKSKVPGCMAMSHAQPSLQLQTAIMQHEPDYFSQHMPDDWDSLPGYSPVCFALK